ncbi:oxidoreductase [Haladaptatus sp. W1]|uniref:DUF7093 family protein n=1 Tax=Haladaptatus sp. W1 TaxID=1897478 RepID=UPI0008497ADC|nr:oxidoreductase [Haladaptatus sp. W1]ODR80331.1 oxidoreductase [Haladaptatus sp. W1]
MGLRCSLLGHDYGESEIEREREEQGNEVVVTVREFEECQRCGNEKVVSENKEVTAIEEPEPTPEPIESKAADRQAEPPSETEIIDSSPTTEPGPESNPEPVSFNDDDFEPPESAEEDDGVILEDEDDEEADEGERGHGEWPEAEDTNVGDAEREPMEWPDTGMEDEGFDAQVSDGSDAEVSFGGSLTPESAPKMDNETEFVEAEPREETGFVRTTRPDPQTDTGFTRAREAPKPDQASESSVDAELVCPECGQFGGAASGSSLRAGDICPECRKGYLSEQK